MPHQINPKQCAVCGACEAECPTGSVSLHTSFEFYVIDPATCSDCGDCTEVCPSEAISPAPAAEAEKDKVDQQPGHRDAH